MSRINTQDIINNIIDTNNYGQIKILEYIGKEEKEYIYKIQFLNTNNIQLAKRSSIKRHSCVDDKLREDNNKLRKNKEIDNRKKLNIFKNQEYIHTNKNLFKILSLDQSTTGCAYSIFIDDQLIKFGKIDTSKCCHHIEKIIKIKNTITEIIKNENIDLLVLEDIYMAYNVDVFKTLAILLGTLEIVAYENNIKCLIQTPYNWKKGIGLNLGKHTSASKKREYQKNQSIQLANKLFYLDLKDDDISDSILIGYHTVKNCIVKEKETFEQDNWG